MIFIRKMQSITSKGGDTSKMESFRSNIGKKVVSKSGDDVGKVHDVVFKGNSVAGIVVSRLFSRTFVGKEFIGKMSNDSIMLSIDPVTMVAGKYVFDADGKKIGKVSKVLRKGNTNNFSALLVKRKIYSKGVRVPKDDIDVSKRNIILKKVYG